MSIFGRLRKPARGVRGEQVGTDLTVEAPTAPAGVPTTRLTRSSNTERRVAGTSFHQDLLAATARQLRSGFPVIDLTTVQCAVLRHGEYAGAVGVYLAGR